MIRYFMPFQSNASKLLAEPHARHCNSDSIHLNVSNRWSKWKQRTETQLQTIERKRQCSKCRSNGRRSNRVRTQRRALLITALSTQFSSIQNIPTFIFRLCLHFRVKFPPIQQKQKQTTQWKCMTTPMATASVAREKFKCLGAFSQARAERAE